MKVENEFLKQQITQEKQPEQDFNHPQFLELVDLVKNYEDQMR